MTLNTIYLSCNHSAPSLQRTEHSLDLCPPKTPSRPRPPIPATRRWIDETGINRDREKRRRKRLSMQEKRRAEERSDLREALEKSATTAGKTHRGMEDGRTGGGTLSRLMSRNETMIGTIREGGRTVKTSLRHAPGGLSGGDSLEELA